METTDTKQQSNGLKDAAEDVLTHGVDYLDTFYKLSVLKLTKKATHIMSTAISVIVILTLGMFVLFFAGLGLGWWLGDLIESRTGGFLLVALFYLIIAGVIIGMRKKIVFPFIRDLIIRKAHE
jgi:hypothetical protein